MFGVHDMNSVADALLTAVHQSETGAEIHGDFDFVVDVICRELGWLDTQPVRDDIASTDFERLAASAGLVFFRAMNGELDFEQSLRERVATLAGLPESVFATVGARVTVTRGVPELIAGVQSAGGKVAVVSGGGSGHEPMHGGFVGIGMLDAACPGAVFTSPTPDQMLEATKAVDGGAGVLHIVKNYTGDIMNFEMAAEMARAEGIAVEAVVIDDDVAVQDSLYTAGRRGVGTTVLAEKICGAAAEAGKSLKEVADLCRKVNGWGRSMGMALTSCTVPHAGKPTFDLPEDEMEIGVGIHGEPGRTRMALKSADEITEMLAMPIIKDLPFEKGDKVIAMVNGMGGTPLIELYIVYRKLAEICEAHGITIARNGGPASTTSVYLRGGEGRFTAVFVDGVRIDSQSTGGATWNAIPLSQVDRIEVLRGPAAAIYGSDAVAGVVQIFTRQGEEGFFPSVRVGVGTHNTRELAAAVRGGHDVVHSAHRRQLSLRDAVRSRHVGDVAGREHDAVEQADGVEHAGAAEQAALLVVAGEGRADDLDALTAWEIVRRDGAAGLYGLEIHEAPVDAAGYGLDLEALGSQGDGLDDLGPQAETVSHLLPQHCELAGLDHPFDLFDLLFRDSQCHTFHDIFPFCKTRTERRSSCLT